MGVLSSDSLFHPEGDSAAGEVVRRELDRDAVAREYADVVLAHLPGDTSEDTVTVVELHPEHRAGERLDDLAFDLDLLFLDSHSRANMPFVWQISCENSGATERPRRGGTS